MDRGVLSATARLLRARVERRSMRVMTTIIMTLPSAMRPRESVCRNWLVAGGVLSGWPRVASAGAAEFGGVVGMAGVLVCGRGTVP